MPVVASTTAYEDLLTMGMPPVNLLVTGAHAAIRNLLGILLRDVDGPILAWYPGEHLVLPRHPRTGTMILYEVGLMTSEDQLRLLRWLERRTRRVQIISTSSQELLPIVERGAFNDMLYYRLNTMNVAVGHNA